MESKSGGVVDSYAYGLFAESNGTYQNGGDDLIEDLREKFHNTVREKIIFLIFFLMLIAVSWTILDSFLRKKDTELRTPTTPEDDESVVYRICFWICVFSLSISIGATLLLPISIVSNEVLLLYPKTYYVQWLNGMLIDGLWNLIFVFANLSLFILLPFAYLFIESEGFSGQKKGIVGKFYETIVVLALTGIVVWLAAYALAAILGSTDDTGLVILNLFSSLQLPFIYSCISFFGVLLLLVCTPLGFARLFTVLSQLLVGPQFLRNLDEEVLITKLEVESQKNTLKTLLEYKQMATDGLINGNEYIGRNGEGFPRKLQQMKVMVPNEATAAVGQVEEVKERIATLSKELINLEKMQKTPGWKRNLVYPLAFIFVVGLTAIAVLMVVLNTLQLLVGIKALPISAHVEYELNQTISLGQASISVLGSWGAALQVVLILFLISTSLIGLYMIPGIRNCKLEYGNSPTSHIIYNCGLVLILSSALPLLARILGITNFDLLGNYGRIEWLGNFWIVVIYNLVFCVASILCLVTKFTSAIRQEIVKRLKIVFRFHIPLFIRKGIPETSYFWDQKQRKGLRLISNDKKD